MFYRHVIFVITALFYLSACSEPPPPPPKQATPKEQPIEIQKAKEVENVLKQEKVDQNQAIDKQTQ